ncbi:chemotaxis protein CheW [Hirschia baltica]|uniref:CheW protein n=1 Tax=Hirschia baltica (strain ATCC 49814 / DSM 5838 / IFAM 1418) TaxID=582402 RepID=C6XL19_HIRBI|nr:chemotaxis protein CheW [Hirschia baltica]ACT57848.1 CheW protein [Hirschia baltica ATCC 49814]
MSSIEYVTFQIGSQTFGTSVLEVHDVFRPTKVTKVPLSKPDIAGVLNLRGRIVTAIDARARLGLPPREGKRDEIMAIGIEQNGESFGLIIDSVGEVVRLEESDMEQNPVNLDPMWASVSKGVHRMDDKLLIVMDIGRILAVSEPDEGLAA